MPSRTRPLCRCPPLEHGQPGNSAWLFILRIRIFRTALSRHRADFLICLIRIREDFLKGAEQSCEGQADSSALPGLADSVTVGRRAAGGDRQDGAHLAGVALEFRDWQD